MPFGTKRPLLEDDQTKRNEKAIKIKPDASPTGTDYSNDVRKKLESSNRTGQACDRCRMRKMRCDGGIEGCGPCLQNHEPCRTTDRMTGVANERGHVRKLEARLQRLQTHINGLENQLRSQGVDVDSFACEGDMVVPPQRPAEAAKSDGLTSPMGRRVKGEPINGQDGSLPGLHEGLSGDPKGLLGSSFISSIHGTSLNVLGMKIDLADNLSTDLDEPDISNPTAHLPPNKSYHACIQTALGAGPKPGNPGLPPRREAFMYADWCFKTVLTYLPILHKPTFFALLTRIYDNSDFVPSPHEIVIIHTVLALMYFQIASRNYENAQQRRELHLRSNSHYHYALGFFPNLMEGRTLEDVQALAMISAQLRSFAKPGACWMVISMTLNVAIELGLHRSANRWASQSPGKSILEIEMRKRVFWSIMTIHVYVSGRLGRPMALSDCDCDIEFPEALGDEALSPDGNELPGSNQCGFLIGIETFKNAVILMNMYNSIYTVKRSRATYLGTLERLEARIQQWREQWPEELIIGSPKNQEQYRVEARYLSTWELELRLLLRHPSLDLTSSTQISEENLTVCMDVSKRMLEHVRWLQRHKSLDTNWQTNVTYVLALATTLYGHWVRRYQLSLHDLEKLRDDMDGWLEVMGEIGSLIGSGTRLQQSVHIAVSHVMATLTQFLASKSSNPVSTAGDPLQTASSTSTAPNRTTDVYNPSASYPLPRPAVVYPSASQDDFRKEQTSYTAPPTAHSQRGAFSYDAPTQQGLQATAATANAYAFPSANEAANPDYQQSLVGGQMAPSWSNFTSHIIPDLQSQEYMTPVSALLQLGNGSSSGAGLAMMDAGTFADGVTSTGLDGASAQQWPILLFGGQPAVQ